MSAIFKNLMYFGYHVNLPVALLIVVTWCQIHAKADAAVVASANSFTVEQQQPQQPKTPSAIVSVKLPIKTTDIRPLKSAITNYLENLSEKDRLSSTLIFQFDTSGSVDGRNSSYSACEELATFITSKRLRSIRTIAYVPRAQAGSRAGEAKGGLRFKSRLSGYSLMVAFACREIWMAEGSSLQGTTLDDQQWEKELSVVQFHAKRGVGWPPEIVRTLTGQSTGLFQVTKANGQIVFVDKKTRDQMVKKDGAVQADKVAAGGAKVNWTAKQLFKWSLIPTPVLNRKDLESRLGGDSIRELSLAPDGEKNRAAILQVDLLDNAFADWAPRSVGGAMTSNKINLLFLKLRTAGSESMAASARFADFIASRDQKDLKTVAILSEEPFPGELLVAMACDKIILSKDAKIGPVDQGRVFSGELKALDHDFRRIATQKGRDWSLVKALVLNGELIRVKNKKTGITRVLGAEQFAGLDDKDQWTETGKISVNDGISAAKAKQFGIVDIVESDEEKIQDRFQISDWRKLEPNLSDRWVRRFAEFVASPGISALVIMIAMFALFVELSAPGLGFPGFVSACLFSLFFWAQYFEGNAEWLEIILFILGVAFIAIEVFVVPGFGIFGIGGIVAVAAGLVLACQDFVIPQTTAEKAQLVYSFLVLGTAGLGIVSGVWFVKAYFKNIPVLNRMVLTPPVSDDLKNETSKKERFLKYVGQVGITETVMRPSGRVRIGDEILEASSEDSYLEKGVEVVVIEVQFGRIKVRATE